MKNIRRIVCLCLCTALATGCAHTRSNTRTEKEGAQILVIDGFESAGEKADHSVETVAVELAVKLGIKAAKKLIDAEAKKYEGEYSAKVSQKWDGLVRAGGDPLADNWLTEGKIVVFSRSVTNQNHGLEWSWANTTSRSQLITKMVDAAAGWVPTEKEELRQRLMADLPTKGYPTFTAIMVVAPFKGTREAMTVSLAGYFYPALKAKRSSLKVPFTKWHKVESAVAIQFTGPEGQRGFQTSKYETTAGFKLGDVKQGDTWVAYKKGDQISAPLAIPTAVVVTTQVKVAESSQMKKKLEELAEKVGKLKPEDLGIK